MELQEPTVIFVDWPEHSYYLAGAIYPFLFDENISFIELRWIKAVKGVSNRRILNRITEKTVVIIHFGIIPFEQSQQMLIQIKEKGAIIILLSDAVDKFTHVDTIISTSTLTISDPEYLYHIVKRYLDK